MKNIGIILAGGVGKRFGKDKPKQYVEINGKELIAYSIDAFKKSRMIDEIIVVLNEEEFLTKRIEKNYNVVCIKGGKTRNESFKNALDYIKNNYDGVHSEASASAFSRAMAQRLGWSNYGDVKYVEHVYSHMFVGGADFNHTRYEKWQVID